MPEDNPLEERLSVGGTEPEQGGSKAKSEPQSLDPQESLRQEGEVALPTAALGPSGEPIRTVRESERRRMNRRELLKLVPVVAVGAFAIPKFRQPLLDEGLAFSDWASGQALRTPPAGADLLQQRRRSLRKFPYNYYDVPDPGVDLEQWTLTVEDWCSGPGITSCSRSRRCPRSCRTRATCASKAGT